MRFLFAIGVLLLLAYAATHIPVSHPPGVLVHGEPTQTACAPKTFDKAGFTLQALAAYSGEALVLSKERYWFDNGARLSPWDLALGWGPMSDSSVVEGLSVSQGSRFYRYSSAKRSWPIPLEEIVRNSANTHFIPANDAVERTLSNLRPGHVIRFAGYLVEATGPGGAKWRSSLSREDSGAGACELLWTEALTVE